ncbi:MAG TPA: SBBP repeat-containing protein [Acidimicrobiales bacterium]|nr:SBBP repeat-containing protein [Acidimicrobiales bacterium]
MALCAALPVPPSPATGPAPDPRPSAAAPADAATSQAYQRLPLRFEANRGQLDSQVDFVSRGPGYTLFLTATEAVFSLGSTSSDDPAGEVVRMRLSGAATGRSGEGSKPLPGVTNYLLGTNQAKWVTDIPGFAKVSYRDVYPGIDVVYYGDAEQRLEYDFNVAPGADTSVIAISIEGHRGLSVDPGGNLVVATGAGDLRQKRPVIYQQIDGERREVSGAYRIDGQLVRFDIGNYDESLPLVIDPVLTYSSYLGGTGADEANSVAVSRSGGFAYVTGTTQSADFPYTSPGPADDARANDVFVAKFATSATGAASLLYATYLGGSMHPDGPPRPCTPNAAGQCTPDPGPLKRAYIYPNGTGGDDFGLGIAVDAAGVAYVTGATTSNDFPTTPNAYDDTCGTRDDEKCDFSTHNETEVYIASDAFVTALDPAGSGLVYSTYLGGSGDRGNTQSDGTFSNPGTREPSGVDAGRAIAIDGTGHVYVTGSTTSPNFPKTMGSGLTPSTYCPLHADIGTPCIDAYPMPDAFLVKIDTTVDVAQRSAALAYGMYFGRPGRDLGTGVALGPDGEVYIAGSSATKFTRPGGTSFDGAPDGFLAKFRPSQCSIGLSNLSTSAGSWACHRYFGGRSVNQDVTQPRESGSDTANAITVDPQGNVYVVGQTDSLDMPTTTSTFQVSRNGTKADGFVASFTSGLGVRYLTYLGGTGTDSATGIAVDKDGEAYVTGFSGSADFPVADRLRPPSPGISDAAPDAFVAKLADNGAALEWSTHLGGGATDGTLANGDDRARGIALDDEGGAYVAGMTVSNDFPTIQPFQDERGGSSDGFLARIDPTVVDRPSVVAVEPREGPPGTPVTITGSGFAGAEGVHFGDVPVSSSSLTTVSDTMITAVSPVPDDPGQAVTISVRTSQAASRSGLDARYTYHQGAWATVGADGGAGTFSGATLTLLDGPSCHKTGVPPPGYCGNVLLVGGGDLSNPPSTATRLFDPKTGSWSPATCPTITSTCPSPLTETRYGHSATLLADGSVLVVGWTVDVTNVARVTAEVYDPATGAWIPALDPIAMRANEAHTATLLETPACNTPSPPPPDYCGKVLVVTGPTAQLFDPKVPVAAPPATAPGVGVHPGRWTPTAGPSFYRGEGHTATVLSGSGCGQHCGKILVAGGSQVVGGTGGRAGGEITAKAELYDPSTGTWEAVADMAAPRAFHSATQLANGKVLVSGGRSLTTSLDGNRSAEVFDPATKQWRPTGRMRSIRHSHTAIALPSGQVLVVGGTRSIDNELNAVVSAELYDPLAGAGSGRWQLAGTVPVFPGWPAPATAGNLAEGAVLLSSRAYGFGAEPAICGAKCGLVLVGSKTGATPTYRGTLYTPPPWVSAISATRGPVQGGVPVTLTGGGFTEGAQVLFGRTPAPATFVSYGEMQAVSPSMPSSITPVRVARNLVGVGVAPLPFVTGRPAGVTDLIAEAISTTQIKLSFSAPGAAGGIGAPARSYVVKQSTSPIGADNFDAARSLCDDGVCGGFEPATVGIKLELAVGGLLPDTRYHYAIKAVDDAGTLGEISNGASDVTHSVDPEAVADLVATAVSASEIELIFGAAGSNAAAPPPAAQYLIRRSSSPIADEAGFDAAMPVCGEGLCRFTPARVGDPLGMVVSGLDPNTTYHFAVRARDEAGNLGPISASVSATTLRAGCVAKLAEPASGQVAYPAGYSLVALPAGTNARAHSRLFSWFDQGAGGAYADHAPDAPVEAGRGYWAWGWCPRLVDLSGAGSPSASFALGAYRASMVGNPSGVGPATITGHDFTARWNPSLNGGAGGYQVSGYRQSQDLAVGEGIWAFAYIATTLSVNER